MDAETWRLEVGGLVEKPLALTLADVKARPARTMPVTLECAGNGRALMEPRPLSQPWLPKAPSARPSGRARRSRRSSRRPASPRRRTRSSSAGSTAASRATSSTPTSGASRVAEAQRDEILLAYEINGQPLPPQHGFPLRLIVPGWYGMTHVKWLRSITAVAEPFTGWQQDVAYHVRQSEEEQGEPVTRIMPRSLMVPPGIPEFLSRTRFVEPGPCAIEGRAWSGQAPVSRVEFSDDGGETWADAELGEPAGEFAWRGWSYAWDAAPGEHELCCRATDEAGNVQPLAPEWNWDGVCNNAVQRVQVVVRSAD